MRVCIGGLAAVVGTVLAGACTTPGDDRPVEGGRADGAASFGELNPAAPAETAHWGQLAGQWACAVSTPAGADTTRSEAIWTWRYILDGHAVQDVYASASSSFRGTGIRIYHPARAQWEISWIANSPSANSTSRVSRFTATSTLEEIRMRRANGDPNWRTVFHDIRDDQFSWFSEPSGQTMVCRRSVEEPFGRSDLRR